MLCRSSASSSAVWCFVWWQMEGLCVWGCCNLCCLVQERGYRYFVALFCQDLDGSSSNSRKSLYIYIYILYACFDFHSNFVYVWSSGHTVYRLVRENYYQPYVLIVSWIDGKIHFKTPTYSLGKMEHDQGQVVCVPTRARVCLCVWWEYVCV